MITIIKVINIYITSCNYFFVCVLRTFKIYPSKQVSCYNFSILSFPGGSDGKESAWNAGDLGLIPGLERSPGEGNDCPLQYSCLENSMDRGIW